MAGSKIGPVHLVSGQNLKAWHGVRREGDPSGIGEDQLWTGDNVRLSGGLIVSRGGQSRLNSSPLTGGCILGIFDDEPWGGAGGPLMLGGGGLTPAGTTCGSTTFFVVDSQGRTLDGLDSGALVSLLASVGISGRRGQLATLSGTIYVNAGTVPLKLKTCAGVIAVTWDSAITASQCAFQEFSGSIYVYSWLGTTGKIQSWDGTTLSSVDTIADASGGFLVTYSGSLYLVAIQGLWKLISGVWTSQATFSLPDVLRRLDAAVYNSVLYVTEGTVIYSWDGAVWATARSIADSAISSHGLVVFNNRLYYLWLKSSTLDVKLGYYDGAWTDDHATLTTDVTSLSTVSGWLVPFGGSLYVCYTTFTGSPDSGVFIVKSSGTDTTTWVTIASATIGAKEWTDAIIVA